MAYPDVRLHNSTSYYASGKISYRSAFCSDTNYGVNAGDTVTDKRGVCLLTEITATVKTPGGDIAATPYTSSGTSYSEFAIIKTGDTSYAVTRVVSATQDDVPEDYTEPTTHQK